jgi:hypothetical protein
MPHDELVQKAARWLHRQGCSIVITELVSYAHEIPDAIGFSTNGLPIVVECKTSLSDFKNDSKKHFRNMEDLGMGSYRYYMIPKGLFKAELVTNKWGLIEVGTNCKMLKDSSVFIKRNHKAEMQLLVSVIKRIGHNAPIGCNIKTYTFFDIGKSKATLGVSVDEDYCI